jgi:hypothetical protein
MADGENVGWLRKRLHAPLALEPKEPAELFDCFQVRRKDAPFSAELIPLAEVANRHPTDNGNIYHTIGRFFRIVGVTVRSAQATIGGLNRSDNDAI